MYIAYDVNLPADKQVLSRRMWLDRGPKLAVLPVHGCGLLGRVWILPLHRFPGAPGSRPNFRSATTLLTEVSQALPDLGAKRVEACNWDILEESMFPCPDHFIEVCNQLSFSGLGNSSRCSQLSSSPCSLFFFFFSLSLSLSSSLGSFSPSRAFFQYWLAIHILTPRLNNLLGFLLCIGLSFRTTSRWDVDEGSLKRRRLKVSHWYPPTPSRVSGLTLRYASEGLLWRVPSELRVVLDREGGLLIALPFNVISTELFLEDEGSWGPSKDFGRIGIY